MYSWEIEELMKYRNYLIEVKEYIEICNYSPQIREIKYDSFNNQFMIETYDNYKVYFKVYKGDEK